VQTFFFSSQGKVKGREEPPLDRSVAEEATISGGGLTDILRRSKQGYKSEQARRPLGASRLF
jgi:hypothetical protein